MTLLHDDRTALRRGQVAVYLLFLLSGMAIGTWTARIPAIRNDLGLGDGQLSLGLLGIAAGAITGMQVVGRLVDHFGSVKVMLPMAFAQSVALILPALAPNLAALTLALFVFGAVHGTLDVAMNANAVEIERAAGRSIMSSFHAVFSIGGFLGAAVGGLLAAAALSPALTFLTVAIAIAGLALWASRWALTVDGGPAAAGTDTGPGRAGRGVLLLGVLAFCCMIGEGAAADWSSVYLHELSGSDGLAAAAYAAFSVMMTAGRLAGDRLAAVLGPVVLVRGCGLLAAAGLGTALLVNLPMAGVIGFACFGAGLSCIVPQVFSAAGRHDPVHAGRSLARVASLGYAGFLTGPVLIGGAAEVFGLSRALAVPVLLAFFVALAASVVQTIPFTK
ncbi:MFS transporter [Planomonospora parontospora subsp. parontospora]|uniref:MFS transporter n=2 Tax=Planomonospora parontospora TaxID=58119 RepID=A0AA37BIT2_9ACTN|nr:MFS transporter [Planomonospora parontospora]GGK77451.1 MFS transporter [Planomonospora parontospora]GII10001.1 MFS transporter [Planomonospora parontospora subsp. parontospora]